MIFVKLTRPDRSEIIINPTEVVHAATVPTSGPLTGSSTTGTRIEFRNQTHQDVLEPLDEVHRLLDLAGDPTTGA
jgi:hypothetical protein